jgi:hypothetical protein
MGTIHERNGCRSELTNSIMKIRIVEPGTKKSDIFLFHIVACIETCISKCSQMGHDEPGARRAVGRGYSRYDSCKPFLRNTCHHTTTYVTFDKLELGDYTK